MCDGDAFVDAMREAGAAVTGQRALLVGVGGAGVAIAHALEPDMPSGARILAKATGERLDGVADVTTGPVTAAQAALATRGTAMALVVLAREPLGLDNEVVVSTVVHERPLTAAPQRRGA